MNDRTAIRGLYVSWALALVMLCLAVSGKHPYDFYIPLRLIVGAVFAYSAVVAYRLRSPLLTGLFVAEAVLFNPLVAFHFKRETWQTLDKISIASIFVAALLFWKRFRASPPL